MKLSARVKKIILGVILVFAHAIFGLACSRAQFRVENMLNNGLGFPSLMVWIFMGISLAVLTTGLFVALVRPFRQIVLALAISSLMLFLFWGPALFTALAVLIYFILVVLFARLVVDEMDKRLNFSVRSIQQEQYLLILALSLMIAVGIAVGYRNLQQRSGTLIPLNLKSYATDIILVNMGHQLERQGVLGQVGIDATLSQMRGEINKFWSGIERIFQPFAHYLAIFILVLVFWLLDSIFSLFSWVFSLLQSVIFSALEVTGLTHQVVDEGKVTRVLLD